MEASGILIIVAACVFLPVISSTQSSSSEHGKFAFKAIKIDKSPSITVGYTGF